MMGHRVRRHIQRPLRLLAVLAVVASMLVWASPAYAALPDVGFTASSSNPVEGGVAVDVVVELRTDGTPLLAPLAFDVSIAGGTASSSDHDFSSPTSLQFGIGDNNGATRTISITALDDTDVDDGETIQLAIATTSGGDVDPARDEHLVTISDDDDGFSVSFQSSTSSFLEGDSSSVSRDVTVVLSTASPLAASQTVDVVRPAGVSGGTAADPADVSFTSPTEVTFPAGSSDGATQTVSVSVVGDTATESDETVILELEGPSAGGSVGATSSHTLTITNDDLPPVISIAGDSQVEGTALSFDVSLSNPSASTVEVAFATANGTAIAPADYTAASGTVTFAPFDTTETIVVTTAPDSLDEAGETLTVTLSSPSGGTLGTAVATGTIIDDDGSPGLSIIDAAPTTEAAGRIDFTIRLSPVSGQEVSVSYSTIDGTATQPGDYTRVPPTVVTFAVGESEKVVSVDLENDLVDEIDETLSVVLSNPVNTTIDDGVAVGTVLDSNNIAPAFDGPSLGTTDAAGAPGFEFATGESMRFEGEFTDPGLQDSHTVTVDWGDGSAASVVPVAAEARTFEATHQYTETGLFTITARVRDADGGVSDVGERIVIIEQGALSQNHVVGLVDTSQGRWYLYDADGVRITDFFFGNPGDLPFLGDWNGDGVETPGLYRQSDGFVYLRDTNTQGPATIQFFFGNPGDVPIAGDFDGDGKDTVSIYRPSNQTFYIINELAANNEGLGAAEVSYVFGNPGDKPFVGDFDGDGIETAGLHRESTGLVYFRNEHAAGFADAQFIYGDPADRIVAGDWNGDGGHSPALFRPSDRTVYFRFENTQGNADDDYIPSPVGSTWLPVAGNID